MQKVGVVQMDSPVRLMRPVVVAVHQCSACGYGSIYRQKAALHVQGRCAAEQPPARVQIVRRTIPADPEVDSVGGAVGGHRVACGSAAEHAVWDATFDAYLSLPRSEATKLTADRVCIDLFRAFRVRAGNVRVRGSNVLEFRGPDNETSVPVAKYCVAAAHDIAQRVLMSTKDSAQRLRDAFAAPIDIDDPGNQTSWATVLRDKFLKRPSPAVSSEALDSLADLYKDMEAVLRSMPKNVV